jgi:proteasome accessory factor B
VRLSVHYSDSNILADQLAGFGPEVVVLSPESLRIAVRDRLLTTARAHGYRDDAEGPGGRTDGVAHDG